MKKLALLLSLILGLLLAIVGCGTQPAPTEPAKQATTEPAKQTPAPAPAPATAKPVSLVEQVKNSGHAKLFPFMINQGPSVKNADTEHYGDGCIRCHSAVAIVDDKNAKLDDFFPGGKYAGQTEGISCRVCHVFSGKDLMTLRNKGWDVCGSCHVNSSGDPKVGSEVHHPQYQFIQGLAVGNDVPAMPSYKYANMKDNFACQDCHITNSQKHDFMIPGVTATYSGKDKVKRAGTTIDYNKFAEMFNQEKCKTCHADPKPVIDKVKQEQTEIGGKLEELKKTYDEWSKKVAAMSPDQQKADQKVKAFQNGATFYTFVEADASKGAHNYPYAKALLAKAEEYWKALQ